MSAFKSPFEKLSYEAQDAMAKSLNPGGALYSLLDRLAVSMNVAAGNVVQDNKISDAAFAAIEGLGIASKRMSKAITKFARVDEKTIDKFYSVFTGLKKTLAEDLDEKTAEQMKATISALEGLPSALIKFGTGLSAYAMIAPLATLGAVTFALNMQILHRAMSGATNFKENVFGVFLEEQIEVFARGIFKLGLALTMFGVLSPLILLGAGAFWLTMRIVKSALDTMGAAAGAVTNNWFQRQVMGKKGAIRVAADNLIAVGGAMLAFGIQMAIATPFLIIGLIGSIAFYFTINKFIMPALKKLGDKRRRRTLKNAIVHSGLILATMILILPSMLILGLIGVISPLVFFGSLVMAFAIPLISRAFAGAGKLLKQIAQGALAVGLIGLSLIPLAFGLKIFSMAFKASESPWEFLGWTIAITSGLGLAMTGLGVVVAATAGAAYLGPLMIAAIGGALIALAEGLKAYQTVKWTDTDTASLTTTLAGVKLAFMGGSERESTGFFSFIGNAVSGAMDIVQVTAAAAMYTAAGIALYTLSKGLSMYKTVKWSDEDSAVLTRALTGISTAFAAVGGQEKVEGGGFFGTIFGIKRTATEEGIRSVMGSGDALKSIAQGLIAFKNIYKNIEFGEADSEGKYAEGTMGYAIVNTMAFVSAAFAQVADKGNVKAGGILGLFGVENNKVEEGIRAVRHSGDALKGIVDGLTSFQAMVKQKIKWVELSQSISFTLGFVSDAFAKVVDKGNVQQGGFFGSLMGIEQNKVAEGIESVKGVGTELDGIASGLTKFQELIKQKIVFGEWDQKLNNGMGGFTKGSLGEGVYLAISFVSQAFAAVADKGKTQQSGFWGSLFGIETSKVKEGVESVTGAQEALNGIADGLTKFKGIEKPKELATKISDVLSMVSNAFAKIEKKEDQNYEDLQNTMKSAGDMYKKISDASNEMNIEAIATTARMFEALGYLSEQGGKTAIEELGDSLVQAIQELAGMIANFEGTVGEAAASNEGLSSSIGGFVSSLNSPTAASPSPATTAPATANLTQEQATQTISQEELIAEIKRLQQILVSGDAVVQVETAL